VVEDCCWSLMLVVVDVDMALRRAFFHTSSLSTCSIFPPIPYIGFERDDMIKMRCVFDRIFE